MSNELEKEIGSEEKQRLSAGSVLVKDVAIETKKTTKGGEAKLVVFRCKHPDKEDIINLSNIKVKIVQGNNETIKKDTMWYHEDSKGQIAKYCNVATVMNHYKKKNLKGFENSNIETEPDAQGFLCIKAY